MMTPVSIKKTRQCAFCKYWYDPCNIHIEPKVGALGIWKYDNSAKSKCLKRNLIVPAFSTCNHYACKVEVD